MFVVSSAEGGAGDVGLRLRRGERGPGRYVQQPQVWSFSLPGRWKPQAVSQHLGPVCPGTAPDSSESIGQAVQDPWRLGQKETQVPKVWAPFFPSPTEQTRLFASHVKNNKSMHVALILPHKEGKKSLMFWTGCQAPQWKCFHGKSYVKKDTWHHMWALKVVGIFKPSESERWLSAAFASLYGAPDTCHLSVQLHTHALLEAPRAALIYHHLFTTVSPLQRRARWEAEPPAEQTQVRPQLLEAPVSVRRPGTNRWSTRTRSALPFNSQSEAKEAGILYVWGRSWGSSGCVLITDSELWASRTGDRKQLAWVLLSLFPWREAQKPPLAAMRLIVMVQKMRPEEGT